MNLRVLRWGDLPGLSCWALKPMRSILMRDNRQKGDNIPIEAEMGAVHLQAKECQQPPEGGKEKILPLSLQSQHLDARLPEL